MSYLTPQINESNRNDSNGTNDLQEVVVQPHWPIAVKGLSPPRTNIDKGVTETATNVGMNELVRTLKEIGPAMAAMKLLVPVITTLFEESRNRKADDKALGDLILAQSQAFRQLVDNLLDQGKLLAKQQKKCEDLEARMKKFEELLELTSPPSKRRNIESTASAPESRPACTQILEPAPVSMQLPTPSSACAPGKLLREKTPTGWSKLSAQASELLGKSAIERLHRNLNGFRSAIGTLSPNVINYLILKA